MVPFYVNIERNGQFVIGNKDYKYSEEEVKVDLGATEENGDIKFDIDEKGNYATMSKEGLKSVTIYASKKGTFFLGNYESNSLNAKRCCVSCGSTTVCGGSVCLDCNGFEVCC